MLKPVTEPVGRLEESRINSVREEPELSTSRGCGIFIFSTELK